MSSQVCACCVLNLCFQLLATSLPCCHLRLLETLIPKPKPLANIGRVLSWAEHGAQSSGGDCTGLPQHSSAAGARCESQRKPGVRHSCHSCALRTLTSLIQGHCHSCAQSVLRQSGTDETDTVTLPLLRSWGMRRMWQPRALFLHRWTQPLFSLFVFQSMVRHSPVLPRQSALWSRTPSLFSLFLFPLLYLLLSSSAGPRGSGRPERGHQGGSGGRRGHHGLCRGLRHRHCPQSSRQRVPCTPHSTRCCISSQSLALLKRNPTSRQP